MNIQRWTSADGDFGPEMWADAEGDYVLFADHQQALSALEARIIELEAIVEAVSHLSAESYSPWSDVIRSARAAEPPKEPAPDPYTNTEGYIGPQ
jgi:hypothetical protein